MRAAAAATSAKTEPLMASGHAEPTRGPLRVSVAELVTKVQEAGGELRLSDPPEDERRQWRRSIAASQGHTQMPAGMRITHKGRNRGDLIIRLSVVEPVAEQETRPPLVPVIGRLARPHPLIAATRAGARV